MPPEIMIQLAGTPQAKGRARAFGYKSKKTGKMGVGHYTPERTRTYEGMIRTAAMEVMAGQAPLAAPVEFHLRAVFPVPASWSKKKRALALAGQLMPAKKPDADNVVKAWTDACNEVVFLDDAQIVRGSFEKVYGEAPLVAVTVRVIGEA
ncbi:RusA family crossover junction endodeoxyribonuclease [Bradyrhizobium sp. Ai1a-2]|uniref:RusA family crossover junction endodeoxyribonuclease n=1 Tax=Bradyrhizobium sp. Ai1a-2 TaxID=196490 RepID=UPI0003F58CFE|nr:RusA family crossover junction endodeoxyribonuclease [Bradyrhizobium sp. Ai1a-2]